MSVSDYQSFNLNLTDTTCLDEVVEALIHHRVSAYQDEIHELQVANNSLISSNQDMECRIRELEDELVKERQGKYEN